jgi:nucleotide-binding universal stress UspA family protein
MTAMRNGIVVGYDGSPGSDQALRWAVEETRAHGCTLTACLAWLPPYLAMLDEAAVYDLAMKRGEEILAAGVRYARSVLGAERVVPLLANGPPALVLREQSASAEMVVLGIRGHGGITGLALGSVPWQVAGHALGPVVIVRAPRHRANQLHGPVVAGLDGSAASGEVARFAFREAELRRVPVLAVCALADAAASLGDARVVEADFDRVLRTHEKEYPGLTVLRHVSAGSPRTALLEAAASAQLLVIGPRGRGGLEGMSLGSVAHVVLHHAPCPVAVVHEPSIPL